MSWQDPRYRGDEWTDEADQQARADVSRAMLQTFGNGRSLAADSWTVGGMGYIHENGMSMLDTLPRESPSWRRRIEKAKRDITTHAAEIRVSELAAVITIEEIENDIKEIRRWANSLSKTQ